jgi:GH15 family glucan-1,4-alpha-glucosidase
MPRETIVGNGRLAIGFDNNLTIRDFFYPRAGLENHVSGHDLKMGIWADGEFQWLNQNWKIETKYMPETLVSRSLASHLALNIHIETNDAVHSSSDVFLRKVMVSNLANIPRKIRIFFTHDFHIYGDPVGDTVMYEPSLNAMVHYKRKRYFLIDGITSKGQGIYQFAAGYKELPGREGTWRDAEDGILSGNSIAQGSVDSAVSFELDLLSKSRGTLYYWIACGKSLKEVVDLDAKVKRTGVEQLLLRTENYWAAWVNKKLFNLSILPNEIIRAYKNSLLIMRSHADHQGGIIASLDSDIMQFNRDTYSYIWTRDGAIAAMAFDLAGFREPSLNFFRFCNLVMDEEGFFHHKYSPDGSVGSTWLPLAGSKEMLPIQEDETALVLLALWKHFQRYRDIEFIESVHNLIEKTTEFILNYIDTDTGLPKPCFDLWEEKWGVFTWTTATVYAALIAAAKFRKVIYDREQYESLSIAATNLKKAMLKYLYNPKTNRFIKAVYADGSHDPSIDSSVSAIFLYGGFDASEKSVLGTMNSIRDRLWVNTQVGGLARYENDEYQRVSSDVPGNPWIICTLWLARWQIACAKGMEQLQDAMELLSWAVRHSLSSGVMAEQIHPYTAVPVSVSPLTWSHAEFVIAVCEYLQKHQEVSSAISEPQRLEG